MFKVRVLGDVNCRGSYSVDGRTTLKKLLTDNAGGMKDNRKLLMIQVGGVLGTFYGLDLLNTPIEEIEKEGRELQITIENDEPEQPFKIDFIGIDYDYRPKQDVPGRKYVNTQVST